MNKVKWGAVGLAGIGFIIVVVASTPETPSRSLAHPPRPAPQHVAGANPKGSAYYSLKDLYLKADSLRNSQISTVGKVIKVLPGDSGDSLSKLLGNQIRIQFEEYYA